MLTCKNVAVINVDNDPKGEKAQIFPYDRVYFNFTSEDKTETLQKKNKGSLIQVDGKVWEGSRPMEAVTKHFSPQLVQDTLNFLMSQYGSDEAYKDVAEENRGWIVMLELAGDAHDMRVRNKIQADNRPKPVQSPEEARAKLAKQYVADMAARGKVVTIEAAMARLKKLEEMEEEEAA